MSHSQVNSKLSNFTLSKLTFTIAPVNKTSEKQYVLNLAESVEIKANKEEHLIIIKKSDDQTTSYYFKTKLSEKIAFVEDYYNKEIFLQDLSNFRRINKVDKNQILNEMKNLNSEVKSSEDKINLVDKVPNANKEHEPMKINNEAVNNCFNIYSKKVNDNSDILLVSKASTMDKSNQNTALINNQNKINEEIINKDNSLHIEKEELKEKEFKENKIKNHLPMFEAKNEGETPIKIASSWNHFIDYVKSNVTNMNPGNQSQEEITHNKERLLTEIMNETIFEEIYVEGSFSKVESPKINFNANLKANQFVADNKVEKKATNLNNNAQKIEKKNDLALNNNKNQNFNKPLEIDEMNISHISGKFEENFNLGSEIIKDLNTQYGTLCLNTANKSNENQVNSMETPILKEVEDPDIIAQQNKIDQMIKQAMSDNKKLKSEYMCENNNSPNELKLKGDFSYSKNLNSFIEKTESREVSENGVNIPEANLNYKELAIQKAVEEKDKVNNQVNIALNTNVEKVKVVNLVNDLPKENYQTSVKDLTGLERDRTEFIIDRSKNTDSIRKKNIDKINENSDSNYNLNKNHNITSKVESSPKIINFISSQNKIEQNPIVNYSNNDKELDDSQSQKKYQPIDVEAFLKTLFSENNNNNNK